MPPKAPSQKRSRTGCITCRIRRVKCDESKPSCSRCTSTGRPCDGYTASSGDGLSSRALATAVRRLHIVGPASRILGQPTLPPQDDSDASCFDFFRVCTASMSATSSFWSGPLLQLAHAEPAVWKGVVAVGALHRRWEFASRGSSPGGSPSNWGEVEGYTKQALRHYWGAVGLAAKSVKDPGVLVVLSVVLAAAANMAGQWVDSQVHIRSGMRLLMQITNTSRGGRRGEMESVAQTLGRLDFQAMVFNNQDAEYKYVEDDGNIPVWFEEVGRMMMPGVEPEVGGGGGLVDLTQASTVIFRLMRYYFTVMAAAGKGCFPPHEVGNVHVRVFQETERWEVEFERLVGELEAPASLQRTGEERLATRQAILSLRLYHATFLLLLTAGVAGPECRWDAHQPNFDRIITLAQELERSTKSPLPFFMSLEPGLVMPLFLVAIRCRHPIARRRALNMLRGLKRQEGMWSSSGATVVAEQVVMAEEENMPFYLPLILENLDSIRPPGVEENGWPMIPEELRISRNAVLVEVEQNQIELFLFRNSLDGNGDYLVKDVILTF